MFSSPWTPRSPRLEIARTQAKAEGRITAAQAEVDLQQERYNKLEPLVRRGTSSSAELARQAASLKKAQGNLTMAMEEIKTAELDAVRIEAELRRRILTSPIDGVVTEITKDVAEPVTASMIQQDSYLVRVVQLDRIKSIAHIPAELVRDLSVGDTLQVRVLGKGERLFEGTVEFVSPIINPATSTVRVRLVLDNSEEALRSGETAQVLAPLPAGSRL